MHRIDEQHRLRHIHAFCMECYLVPAIIQCLHLMDVPQSACKHVHSVQLGMQCPGFQRSSLDFDWDLPLENLVCEGRCTEFCSTWCSTTLDGGKTIFQVPGISTSST